MKILISVAAALAPLFAGQLPAAPAPAPTATAAPAVSPAPDDRLVHAKAAIEGALGEVQSIEKQARLRDGRRVGIGCLRR